jgi:cell division protein FtsB
MFFYLLIIYTALIYGIVGERGVLINRDYANQIHDELQEVSSQQVVLENAKRHLDTIWSKEALLDRARSLGYVQRQDEVYYFSQEMEMDTGSTVTVPEDPGRQPRKKTGISLPGSFLIALVPTVLSLLGYAAIRRNIRKRQQRSFVYPHLHQ